jgi:hypothetical protein
MNKQTSPSRWCRHMSELARDGAEAYAYHQLAELWQQREQGNDDQARHADRAALD